MKPAHFGCSEWANSGITAGFTRSTGSIYLSGWYDGMVGIQGESMTLREFFDRVGIKEADCKKAFSAKEGATK